MGRGIRGRGARRCPAVLSGWLEGRKEVPVEMSLSSAFLLFSGGERQVGKHGLVGFLFAVVSVKILLKLGFY